jgi:translation initiation factor IF-3
MNFDSKRYRINSQIRAHQVRVSHNNNQLGILTTEKARNYAFNLGLDLIETVPNASPPVCIVDDFGKFRYENKLKEKEAKKKQRSMVQEQKEIRLTPTITDHDLQTKSKAVIRFLQESKKVQVMMRFSHRELHHKDIGFVTIDKLVEAVKGHGILESKPRFMGQKLFCIITPLESIKNAPASN